MAASETVIGFGVLLSASTDGSTYTGVGELREFSHTQNIELVDVTHSESPNANYREWTRGISDGDEATFECNYVPKASNFVHATLNGSTYMGPNIYWKAKYPTISAANRMHTFRGHLTSLAKTVPYDDRMSASGTIRVTSVPTEAAFS